MPNIISIRGTNGAGKSHIVHRLLSENKEHIVPEFIPGRKRPIGYFLRKPGETSTFIVGHYDIANGGADTIKSIDQVYTLIRTKYGTGHNVLYEGKNVSESTTRISRLPRDGIRLVFLNTDLKTCIDSVRKRGHNIAEHKIEGVYNKTVRNLESFTEQGFNVFVGNREECYTEVLELCK